MPPQPHDPAATAARVEEDLAILASDAELAGMFFAEALDHLGSIEATVLQLEATPADVKLLNDVFRPFHTVKGNAGALGVSRVQELAHKVENLLDLARSGQLAMAPDDFDLVLRSVDVVTTLLVDLQQRLGGQPGTDHEAERLALMAAVDARLSGDAAPPAAVEPEPVAAPATPIAPFSEPVAAATVDEAVFDLPAPATAPVATPAPAPVVAAAPPARPFQERADDAPPAQTRRVDDQASVKVDTRKLDNLVDMVGELVIVQSIIQEDPLLQTAVDERLTRNMAQLRRITSDLQRNAMSMRMLPIRQTFQKMARLVRDLSKKNGKPVELVLSGEDTELDRRVIESINDPLMHMVRNSMDHGLETPETRLAAGKPAQGTLSLSAFHQGGNIVIAIADDGGGLNTERIRAKAIAQGLIGGGDELSNAEIHQLIFRPGFSTAEKVTEISGRGVGMDVVRRNIEAMRGRIEIQSTQGRGTTFFIKLPLTLAIVDGLLLSVGAQRFVLPTFAVRESLRPTPAQVHRVQGRPCMIQVRDSLLPLIRLADLFGIDSPVHDPCDATVVVVEDDGRCAGVIVDALLGKQEVVIKPLGDQFAGVRGVAGGAILGDGRVGLILDAPGVIGTTNDESRAA
jgi:two-component system chemotaxis sensor kinase CheA